MMKLRAFNCKNMGAILVHQNKPDGAPTDLVAEVHSGLEDAAYIAECVNAASIRKSDGFNPLEFQVQGFIEQKKVVTWPEDVAGDYDPTAIQGGVVGNNDVQPVAWSRSDGTIVDADYARFVADEKSMAGATPLYTIQPPNSSVHELLSAIETLLDGVDLQVPEGFTPENADGTLCGRTVSVFGLIRCAQILARVRGGAE